jgi:hypothetical protein
MLRTEGAMKSFSKFRLKHAASVLKLTQGLNRRAPAKGSWSLSPGTFGCGCRMCDIRERDNDAPAEAPERMMLEGFLFWSWIRYERTAFASCN